MFVPADSFDVVPGCRLVALVALIDACMRPAGNACRDHFEMHHVVAGGSLMALAAVVRFWRWMLVLRNRPTVGRMTLGTVATKKALMSVIVGVARRAIERRFECTDPRMWRSASTELVPEVAKP